jgi:aromatic-L-amino-acid/L-tryptophan decarboxylase
VDCASGCLCNGTEWHHSKPACRKNYFYNEIKKSGFETGPYPDLTVTIFRYKEEGNDINQQLIDAIHKDGRVFLSSTVIKGKLWLRSAIVSHRTHVAEVILTLEMIKENVARIMEVNHF